MFQMKGYRKANSYESLESCIDVHPTATYKTPTCLKPINKVRLL